MIFSSADFSAAVIMRCLNITIVEDSDAECDQDFTVGIESISPAAAVSGDLPSSITVNIVDGKSATHQCLVVSTRYTFVAHFESCVKHLWARNRLSSRYE